MKKVFSDISQIAHLWANQLQDKSRNSGNFYFDGKTIYSYGKHFPIAKHVEANGVKAVLFTEQGYSNTTSKHISVVYQACSHLDKIYCKSPDSSHDQNFEFWARQCERILDNLKTARKPEKYLNELSSVGSKVKKYSKYFNIEIPKILSVLIAVKDKEEFEVYKDSKAKLAKEVADKRAKELKARHKKDLAKWRKGESSRLYVHDGYDYIRLVEDRFETSQGVKVPIETGLRFYEWVKSIIAKGGCDNCNKYILNYQVRSVSKENIVVGCHTITIKEIERAYSSAQLATV